MRTREPNRSRSRLHNASSPARSTGPKFTRSSGRSPSADGIKRAHQAQIDAAKAFVIAHKIVTLPPGSASSRSTHRRDASFLAVRYVPVSGPLRQPSRSQAGAHANRGLHREVWRAVATSEFYDRLLSVGSIPPALGASRCLRARQKESPPPTVSAAEQSRPSARPARAPHRCRRSARGSS